MASAVVLLSVFSVGLVWCLFQANMEIFRLRDRVQRLRRQIPKPSLDEIMASKCGLFDNLKTKDGQ